MNSRYLHETRHKEAFTLIEILCVILIISILAALVVGMGRYARDRALRARANSQMMQISGMAIEYKVRNGRMPPSISNIVSMLPAGFTYSNSLPLDPWYNQYQYTVNGDTYRVFSIGPDKLTGTGDDVEFNR